MPNEVEHNENRLITQRRKKLAKLREQGNAFPNYFRRNILNAELLAKYQDITTKELMEGSSFVKITGRLMTKRVMGKASFAHIRDISGDIQLYIKSDDLAKGVYAQFKCWDLGDIIAAEGVIFRTHKGELSISVDGIYLLTKSLRPLPGKFHSLSDQETRYRQRHVDLIMNQGSRDIFIMRARIINGIRRFLTVRDYLEVETPMMQSIPGGATARPFITYHNAFNVNLFLRISPELHLKRLVVGGFERVFEIGRSFRNEGLSTWHNPEFTMVEFYQAYADFNDFMDLTEDMIRTLTQDILGTLHLHYQGADLDFSKSFRRMTVDESILNFNPDLTSKNLSTIEAVSAVARTLSIPLEKSYGLGKIIIEIFEKTVEHKLLEPTFITAYPTEISPLARRSDNNPFLTDRFEFFVGGREIANGFSELNDSEDQAERFRSQEVEKNAGDYGAMYFDNDYISALEYGMPPTAGEGIGIDRLVMLLTNSASIKDVLLFPYMRPKID